MIPLRRLQIVRIALSILPCVVLLVTLASPGTPLLARLLIVSIAAVTIWNPAAGLLTVAGLAPLGAFIAALDGIVDFRMTELILLSFIATWLPSTRPEEGPGARSGQGPRLPRYAWAAAWLFSVLLASLCFGLSRQLLRYPDALRINIEAIAFHYFGYGDPTGLSDAARMLEGFALVGAAMELVRRRPGLARSLPVALAISAMAAALTSVLLWFGIGPQQVLAREAILGYRFSAHVLDVNAAGSHFAMMLCLALGIASRERGRSRAFWVVAALACATGLWMTRSRSAEAAAGLVIPFAFLWATTTEWTKAKRLSVIGAVLGALLVFGMVRGWQIEHDPTYTASGFRQQFVMSSFRVIGTHPYLGIGPGRYFRDSPNFLTPQLAWVYGSENAHNNYLQIATEEGIIGFFVYAVFFAGAIGLAFRALARTPHDRLRQGYGESRRSEAKADWRLLGATAGVIAFLGSCLTGHPLLVPEVATAFFLQLALAASLGGSTLLGSVRLQPDGARPPEGGRYMADGTRRLVMVTATILFAVLPAWTLEKPLVPVHLEEVDGMYYGDEGTADGVPFHWTREYASLYAKNSYRVVEIPLRVPPNAKHPEQIVVDITSGGVLRARAMVGSTWSNAVVTLPSPEPPLLFSRINLQVNHVAQVADLVPGSTDPRVVGVQVGDLKILSVAWEFVPLRRQD